MTPANLKREDDRQEPGLTERLLMVVSFAVTIGLFAFTTYHALTVPADAEPTVAVVGTQTTAEGVLVEVELEVIGNQGFRSVAVEVTCDTPPPEITFEHVPVGSVRQGRVMCPPGTAAPQAQVTALVPT